MNSPRWKANLHEAFMKPYIYWFALVIANMALFAGTDYEILCTKPYIYAGGYYGGYSRHLIDEDGAYHLIQLEAITNYLNVRPMAQTEPSSPLITGGHATTDRMINPFLVACLIQLSFGSLSIDDGFFLLSVLLWLMTIVLVYRISLLFFNDKRAAFFSSLLTIALPVYTLTFQAFKVQQAGPTFMLLGIYLHEKYVFRTEIAITRVFLMGNGIRLLNQFLLMVMVFFLGFYFSGGNLFFLFYLFGRYVTTFSVKKIPQIVFVGLTFVIALIAAHQVNALFEATFVSEKMGLGKILSETVQYVVSLVTFEDVSELRFLNYKGYYFFTTMFPHLLNGLVRENLPVLLCAGAGAVFFKKSRSLFLIALLLMGGHFGTFVYAWTWYYGYMSGGTILLLILTAGSALSSLSARNSILKAVSYVLLLISIQYYMIDMYPSIRFQLSNYFNLTDYQSGKTIHVYHDNIKTTY